MPLHNFEPGTHSNAVSVRHSIDFPQSLNLPNETSYLSSKRKTFDLKSRLKMEVRLKKNEKHHVTVPRKVGTLKD